MFQNLSILILSFRQYNQLAAQWLKDQKIESAEPEDLQSEPSTSLDTPASAASLDTEDNSADTTANDLMLAQMLQYEFDLEHDMNIERTQRQTNKNSKLSISLNNFKILPSLETHNYEFIRKEEDPIDEIEAGEQDEPIIPSCGYVEHNGKLVTKHDSAINSRKNTKKMLKNLPLDVNTGDAGGFTINMPNKVYNQLNETLNADNRRKQRHHDKVEKGTLSSHMDENTTVSLLSLVNAGMIEELGGVISSGKEAIVYHSVAGSVNPEFEQQDCVVKIFKTRLAEFKTRERYIRDDHRFKDRMTKTNNFSVRFLVSILTSFYNLICLD